MFFLSFFCFAQSETVQKTPNNVLLIAIDDLRTELNCYGASHIKSPNIDRLAANGIRFTNPHVQQAICMASRASILNGIRPERYGMYTRESVSDVMPVVLTMNRFFEQQGYAIASSGKIYHFDQDTKDQFGKNNIEANGTWKGLGYVTKEAIEKIGFTEQEGRGPAYESESWRNAHDDESTLDVIFYDTELSKSRKGIITLDNSDLSVAKWTLKNLEGTRVGDFNLAFSLPTTAILTK